MLLNKKKQYVSEFRDLHAMSRLVFFHFSKFVFVGSVSRVALRTNCSVPFFIPKEWPICQFFRPPTSNQFAWAFRIVSISLAPPTNSAGGWPSAYTSMWTLFWNGRHLSIHFIADMYVLAFSPRMMDTWVWRNSISVTGGNRFVRLRLWIRAIFKFNWKQYSTFPMGSQDRIASICLVQG